MGAKRVCRPRVVGDRKVCNYGEIVIFPKLSFNVYYEKLFLISPNRFL